MAQITSSFLPFLFLCLSFSHVLTNPLEDMPITTFFNVTASVQKTIDILSFDPKTLKDEDSNISPSTIKLRSIHHLRKPTFKTYRGLTISRLERDLLRVKYLHQKQKVALTGVDLSSSVVPFGGQYYVRVGFGTPAVQLNTLFDTGSDITWIQSSPCTNCYNQTDPIFNPSTSSTYKTLPCDSAMCQHLKQDCSNSNTCKYHSNYADGSHSLGDLATERVTFGTTAIENMGIGLGLGHDNEGILFQSNAAGIVGFNRAVLSLPSQDKAMSFAYCLVERDSTLTTSTLELGSQAASGNNFTTPLIGENYYYVGMTGLSVGGKMLPATSFGKDGVVIDSGTVISRFPSDVYNALRDEFVKGMNGLKLAQPVDVFDTCYDLASLNGVEIPTVGFHFGEQWLSLPAKNVLFPMGNNIFCFAFAPVFASMPVSIIGNTQQQGIRISFDLQNSVVGFSPNVC